MDYLEDDRPSRTRLSGGGPGSGTSPPEEVVLPKQQFFFSSTSVADAYTPPTVKHETKRTSKLLMGPRPWGGGGGGGPSASRGLSEPSPRDVNIALDQHHETSGKNGGIKTDQNSNYRETTTYSKPTSSRTTTSVARTIADLDESPDIRAADVQEAINYRVLDRSLWT